LATRYEATDIRAALSAAKKIPDATMQGYIISVIVGSRFENEDWAAVIPALTAQRELAAEGVEPSHPSYDPAILAVALAEQGDAMGARAAIAQALNAMNAKSVSESERATILGMVARAQARLGEAATSKRTMKPAIDLYERLALNERSAAALNVAAANAILGDVEAALRQKTNLQGLDNQRRQAQTIAMIRMRADDVPGALKALTLTPATDDRFHPEHQPATVAEQVAFSLAASNDATRALKWSEAQLTPFTKVRALIGTARGMAARDELKTDGPGARQ
jgi:hypothetical protein